MYKFKEYLFIYLCVWEIVNMFLTLLTIFFLLAPCLYYVGYVFFFEGF